MKKTAGLLKRREYRMERVVAIFDIGKTNKKLLLFNGNAELVHQAEEKFPVTIDEDGFECDDIALVEKWIIESVHNLASSKEYELRGINFSTYGASLAFVDKNGHRLTPIYNYLKPVDERYARELFEQHGGQEDFCRQTASPALGLLLNSAIQLKWLKTENPSILNKTEHILHFPQYLSYLLTKQGVSEYTSIGCHTFLWDFDKMQYHEWLKREQLSLPAPVSNSEVFQVNINGCIVGVGVGIHDSSASLVPYLRGYSNQFLLLSTGTWCINMNPFNHSPLTNNQLLNDCLCYMSVNQKPVKSSRLFMGHIHDVNSSFISTWFKTGTDDYKNVKLNINIANRLVQEGNHRFFTAGVPSNHVDESVDLSQFSSFEEAYHQFMFDLTALCARSMNLVLEADDTIKDLFVSGGFARNPLFLEFLAAMYPNKDIFTSRVDNSSALGAALAIIEKVIPEANPVIDLGLKRWERSILGVLTH